MKYKKIISIFCLFSLCGCNSKYLDKDPNTNLEFWITQKVTDTDFTKCTFLPGWFGAREYLDSRYVAIEDEGTMLKAPDIHVTYLVTAYPDYTSNNSCITNIEITDPEIYVYGLSMKSSNKEISAGMEKQGFKNNAEAWKKNNCTFYFSKDKITISAKVTNKRNIVF